MTKPTKRQADALRRVVAAGATEGQFRMLASHNVLAVDKRRKGKWTPQFALVHWKGDWAIAEHFGPGPDDYKVHTSGPFQSMLEEVRDVDGYWEEPDCGYGAGWLDA